MKTHTHTPGPWSVAFYGETERPVIKHGNQSIADVRGCELDDSTSNSLANARLIASAPDLLAQLKRAVAAIDAERIHCTPDKATPQVFAWWDDILKQARAAIAKAEGVK
jgi:hypothetical protein